MGAGGGSPRPSPSAQRGRRLYPLLGVAMAPTRRAFTVPVAVPVAVGVGGGAQGPRDWGGGGTVTSMGAGWRSETRITASSVRCAKANQLSETDRGPQGARWGGVSGFGGTNEETRKEVLGNPVARHPSRISWRPAFAFVAVITKPVSSRIRNCPPPLLCGGWDGVGWGLRPGGRQATRAGDGPWMRRRGADTGIRWLAGVQWCDEAHKKACRVSRVFRLWTSETDCCRKRKKRNGFLSGAELLSKTDWYLNPIEIRV